MLANNTSIEKPSPAKLASADPVFMQVNLDALQENFKTLREMVGPETHIIPSIKGDGYGIGASVAAAEFAKAGAYSVATGSIYDALAIRQTGNEIPIHMFPGVLPEAMDLLYEHKLTPTIYSADLARAASAASKDNWRVFIKVDAGFGRLGVPLSEAKQFVQDVARLPGLEIEGIFTHIPFGDEAGAAWAVDAITGFNHLLDTLENGGLRIPISQCLASGGVLRGLQARTRCNTVCVGHLLYGGLGREPLGAEKRSKFTPAIVKVCARIIHIRRHQHDAQVGSGGKIPMRAGAVTGAIPIGLHEGYRSAAPGRTSQVLVNGTRAPVLFVSQEYTVVDLSQVEDVSVGDEITVFGKAGNDFISIEEMALWQGQSPLHVVMNMNRRLPMRFMRREAQ